MLRVLVQFGFGKSLGCERGTRIGFLVICLPRWITF